MSAERIYFFIISPLILAFAIWQLIKQIKFFAKSVPARGRIIGLDPQKWGRYRTYYYLTVEFNNERQEHRVFVGGIGTSRKREALIGRPIDVRYIPGKDAETARVWTFWTVAMPILIFFSTGIGLLWLAIAGGPGFRI